MFGINIFKQILKITDGESVYKKLSLDPAVVKDGKVVNPGALSQSLAVFLQEQNLSSLEAWVGINDQDLNLRSLSIPSDEEASLYLNKYVEESLHYNLEDVYISYQEVAGGTVQFVVVKKEIIDNYVEAFERAGVEVKGFIPVSSALTSLTAGLELPHLLVVQEEGDLLFVLIGEGGFAVHTSIYSVKLDDKDSAEKVIEAASEFLESAKDEVAVRDIRKFYISGEQADKVAKPLEKMGLLTEVLEIDKPDYVTAVALAKYKDAALLVLPHQKEEKEKPNKRRKASLTSVGDKKEKVTSSLISLLQNKSFVGYVVGFVAVALAGLLGYLLLKGPSEQGLTAPVPPERSTHLQEPEEASPSSALEEVAEATPSPEQQASPSAEQQVFTKSDYSIQVLNGWGVQGMASAAENYLESLGWRVVDIGNTYWKRGVTVKTKQGADKLRDKLQADLSAKYVYMDDPQLLEDDSNYDAVVIIGSQSE